MKYVLIALLVMFNPITASAQKEVFWANGGISLARFVPGASVTYNYCPARFLGIGAGAQIYDFHATRTNFQPVPALFWDLRCIIGSQKKSQFFLFLDVGMDVYKHNDQYWVDGTSEYVVRDDNGIYTGLGIGYFRPQTARGWGHYVSLKIISNHYDTDAYSTVTRQQTVESWNDATLVVSYGYKF